MDVTERLVDGLVALVFVYRDYLGDNVAPLLPWLHSTETCEHVFAECRKLVKDFTYLDFLYMVPRLHVVLRSIISLLYSTDAKARVSGYADAYYNADGMDISVLAQFSTDSEIAVLSTEAWQQNESIWSLLGVIIFDNSGVPIPLGIASFGPFTEHPESPSRLDDPFDYAAEINDSDSESQASEDLDAIADAEELDRLIREDSRLPLQSRAVDAKRSALACATLATSMDDLS